MTINEQVSEGRLQNKGSLSFAAIANSIDQMIWSTRPDGYHDYYNDRWYEYTGVPHGSTDGDQWNGMFHPDDQERAWKVWSHSLGTGEPYHIEYRLRHKSGEYRWVIGRAQCVRDEQGGIERWYGTCTDVHDLKLAEQQIRRNRDTFYNLIQNNPFGVYVIDADFKLAEVSLGSQKVFENVRPLIGRDFAEVLRIVWAEPFASKAIQRFRHTLETGEPYSSPSTVENRNDIGAVEAYDWRIERLDLPDGRHGVVCYFYDLSERLGYEAALKESEARLRALTDSLPAGMVYQMHLDPISGDRRFIYVSKSHEKLTGVPAEEVLRDPLIAYNLILPEDREKLAEAEEVAIRDKSIFDQELRFRRADGEVRWCRITSEIRTQPDGSLISDGIQIDITEQKLAEQELRELNATLEERVAQRAEELAQAQEALRQSQKLESMGQLTGGVAHDFNNLLTPIIGGLDLLQRRRTGDERAQRTIEGALASAERAKTLVQRLLAFARRQPLQPKAVEVHDLVIGMSRLLESTLGPRISLELKLDEGVPAARADANQLEMALLNLALNARDAMPEGGTLTVIVECIPADRAGETADQVQVSVIDTGMGMDEQTLNRAVEPFFSTKGVGRGTGLGLSMVHGLAAQLGGKLLIDSQLGGGTAVRLRLPAIEPDSPRAETSSRKVSHVGGGIALLVDDEDLVRASTAEMLADIGYEVVEESTAEAALERMRDGFTPALLVTDHLMPGMTGTALARAARELSSDLPVIIISGYAEVDGIAGDLPRLTKPFRRDELESCIALLGGDASNE